MPCGGDAGGVEVGLGIPNTGLGARKRSPGLVRSGGTSQGLRLNLDVVPNVSCSPVALSRIQPLHLHLCAPLIDDLFQYFLLKNPLPIYLPKKAVSLTG